jgi:hypothetical protein
MSGRTALFLSIIRRKILTVACFLPTFSWQVSDSSAHHRLPTTYALPQYPCRQCACGRETTEYAQGPDFRNKCRELSNVILRQTFTLYALFRTVLCVPVPPSSAFSWAHQSTSVEKVVSRMGLGRCIERCSEACCTSDVHGFCTLLMLLYIRFVASICRLLYVQCGSCRAMCFLGYRNAKIAAVQHWLVPVDRRWWIEGQDYYYKQFCTDRPIHIFWREKLFACLTFGMNRPYEDELCAPIALNCWWHAGVIQRHPLRSIQVGNTATSTAQRPSRTQTPAADGPWTLLVRWYGPLFRRPCTYTKQNSIT